MTKASDGRQSEPPGTPDLPEMNDEVLDQEQLAALFRDYRACPLKAVEIVLKQGPGRVTRQGAAPTLPEAEQLLMARNVRGVQVRYRYDGAQWCDTLMPAGHGVRLLRVRHPLDADSPPPAAG